MIPPVLRGKLAAIQIVVFSLALTAFSGCQSVPQAKPAHDTLRPDDLPVSSGQPAEHFSPDELTAKDRCPARLHEIEGGLLLYYAMKKQMPASLEELKAISNTPLNLTCPDSGLPYAYSPNGLRKPGGTKHIVVYDPVMNKDGTRWCIVAAEGKPGAAQATEVVQIAEPVFLTYQ
jgi:hypothetical protein